METPEEFCKNRGFNGGQTEMTENCLMWAMMRQYAEYYHKLVIDEDLAGVRLSLPDTRQELLKQAQEVSESDLDQMLPEDIKQHNYNIGVINYLLDIIYGSNEA